MRGPETTRAPLTELELARNELQQLERLAAIGAWSWDTGNDQITVSDGFRKIFGLEPETSRFSPDELLDRLHPDDRTVAEGVARSLRPDDPVKLIRIRVQDPDGEIRELEGRTDAVFDDAGRASVIHGVVQDVTERVRAGQHREAIHAVTRALANADDVDEAIEGVLAALAEFTGWHAATFWLVDADAGVLRCRRVWEGSGDDLESFAATTRELELKPGHGVPGRAWRDRRPVWRDVDPADDLAAYPRREVADRAGLAGVLAFPVMSGTEVTGVIDLWRRPSGSPQPDLIDLVASTGSQIGLFIERKRELSESRELLAETQRLAELGSWKWETETGRVVASDELFRLLDVDPRGDDVTLATLLGRVDPEHQADLRRAFERCAADGEHVAYRRTPLADPVGSVRVVEWFAEPEERPDGHRVVHGTAQNVTPEDDLEAELGTRARQQAAVAQFGSEALVSSDFAWLVERAVELVADVLDIEHTGVLELLPGGYELLLRAGRGWDDGLVGRLTVSAGRSSYSGYVLEVGEPVISEDLSREERFTPPPQLLEHGLTSGAGVVIAGDGGPFGTLGAFSAERRRFSADDISFMQGVANVLAGAFTADRAAGLERQLQQAQRLDSVGKLAGGIAHDFNNLLSVILNHADFAIEEIRGSVARGEIEEIKRAAERAADLTRQLLLFSREEIAPAEVIDPGALVARMKKILARTLGEQFRVETTMPPGLPSIRIAARLLEQVLLNLVLNARDAMPEGGLIAIEAESVTGDRRTPPPTSDAGYVRISVSDSGKGMAPEVVDRAFEPFFTTKPEGEGTGLGLATAYGIVQRAGGRIEIDSELGRGTTVHVHVPAGVAARGDRAAADPAQDGFPRGSETVLLVEDEEPVRRLTRRILERSGYTVVDADGPDAATELWRRCGDKIDLLLTDVVMPGRSGIRLWQELSEDRPGLEVIYMSGYARDRLSASGGAEDAEPLLQKPFSSEELLQAVRSTLAGSREG